ncbi:MAG: hypothetical protein WC891_01420 [Actinomycetota bacterium]
MRGPNKQTAAGIFVRILLALGAAGLAWALLGLFWPVSTTTLSGALDSGQPYTTTFMTFAYNSLFGLLVLLAASVNLSVALRLFQRAYSGPKAFLWAVFSGLLLAVVPFIGDTPVVSWLPGIPAEIQHGISTPYVKVIEKGMTNVPLLVAVGFIIAYIAAAVLYASISFTANRPHRR